MEIPGAFASRKCPCCNNPWNVADYDTSSFSCTPCRDDTKGFKGIDPANIDPSVDYRENFYKWSNGNWLKSNEIPPEYSSWNTFIALRDMNLERIKSILDEISTDGAQPTSEEKKLSSFYSSAMDETTIENLGVKVLHDLLSVCKSATLDPSAAIATLHSKFGVRVLFSLYSSPDKTNSEHSIGTISQSGLGLPDRDYYFDQDKQDKRSKYIEYISNLFALLYEGDNQFVQYDTPGKCYTAAKEVVAIETALATSFLTRTACRDPVLTYNKMSIEQLKGLTKSKSTPGMHLARGTLMKDLDWDQYFASIGKSSVEMEEVNISTVGAVKAINSAISHPSFVDYLSFHCINSFAPYMHKAVSEAYFNFHEKELKGTAEQRPRWKRALESLEDALGDALGTCYVRKYFAGDAKHRALRIVELVRSALRTRLQEVEWMNAATKEEALKKMERFKVKIGYPDKWIDYSLLLITKGQYTVNVSRGRAFAFALDVARMNAPTDRLRWFMTPQTINAYYHPSLNEIVFPAAILQAPFFDPEADEAVNFGSMGAVVGHEMTHGFDDQGRKFDYVGNMRDWWTAEDGKEYERRSEVMVTQAEAFSVHGVSLKGKLTCGENIADLGGLKLAYKALMKVLVADDKEGGKARLPINGFKPEQRFFLAWSQCWRENVRKERALQLITLDPHGPNEWRCNGPLSNMEEFYEAFGITEGDAMYRPSDQRVNIW